MGWKVHREGRMVRWEDIELLEGLVHESFRELDINFYIYDNVEELLEDWWSRLEEWDICERIEFVQGSADSAAFATYKDNNIFLLEDDLLMDMYQSEAQGRMWLPMYFNYTILHEVRHIQQFKRFGEKTFLEYDDEDKYHSTFWEWDANKFATRMMNRHKKVWKEKYGIGDFDWVFLYMVDKDGVRLGRENYYEEF